MTLPSVVTEAHKVEASVQRVAPEPVHSDRVRYTCVFHDCAFVCVSVCV